MYVTDLTDFIDPSGAIGPVKGPARAMAQFHVDAHASDTKPNALPAQSCFKHEEIEVMATRAHDDAIVWACAACRTEGLVSNWQGNLWDLRDLPPARG